MYVHRCARVGFVLAVNLATAAAAAPLWAESLSDGLAKPANRALAMGPWAAKITLQRPEIVSWRPTISVTVAVPKVTVPKIKATATIDPSAVAHPYGLRGPIPEKNNHATTGLASYYGSSAGVQTATGERFDPSGMTAAHRTLPFGMRVKVTRVDTGESVVVRINDRGPFKPGRVIDLSEGAAKTLKMTDVGLTSVRLEVMN